MGWVRAIGEWTASGPKLRRISGLVVFVFSVSVLVGVLVGGDGARPMPTEFAQEDAKPESEGGIDELAAALIEDGEELAVGLVGDSEDVAEGLVDEGLNAASDVADEIGETFTGESAEAGDASSKPAERNPYLWSLIVLIVIVAVFHYAVAFLLPEEDDRGRRSR